MIPLPDDLNGASFVAEALGFCGCGSPERVEALLLRYMTEGRSEHDDPTDDWLVRVGDTDEGLFVAYMLDRLGWVDHGGSVYSQWPTELGHQMVALLEERATLWDEDRIVEWW